MARSTSMPAASDEAEAFEAAADEEERRWPVLYSVIFVVVTSALLWALIIGGIGWLIA